MFSYVNGNFYETGTAPENLTGSNSDLQFKRKLRQYLMVSLISLSTRSTDPGSFKIGHLTNDF